MAKQVLIFWGIKVANFCQEVLNFLGSYPRVFQYCAAIVAVVSVVAVVSAVAIIAVLNYLQYLSNPTMVGAICKGDLNMVNFVDVVKSLNTTWVIVTVKRPTATGAPYLTPCYAQSEEFFSFQCNFV